MNKDLYIGFSTDLKNRFNKHNNGLVKSTKPYIPWKLVYYEAYKDKRDALIREKKLKQHRVKNILREQIKCSLI